MSASRPSTLVIDDDDDWGTFSPLPSGSSRVSSLANSGEFNAFAVVGSVAGGGGAKRQLWILPNDGTSVCFGKVGLNNKICVKECIEDKTHCGVNHHGQKLKLRWIPPISACQTIKS
jgi:hypothetical protein